MCANHLGDAGGEALGELLAVNTRLTSLDVREAAIGVQGGKALGAGLALNHVCVLTLLNLQGDGEAPLPIRELRGTVSVDSLDIQPEGGERLGMASAVIAAALVAGNNALTSINVDGTDLPMQRLSGADPVETLDFSRRNLGPASAMMIAALVRKNSTLTQLGLARNQLCGVSPSGSGEFTADGVVALAEALEVNRVLRSLDLSSNALTNAGDETTGIDAVGSALKSNDTITALDLTHNRLSEESSRLVAEALKANAVSRPSTGNLRPLEVDMSSFPAAARAAAAAVEAEETARQQADQLEQNEAWATLGLVAGRSPEASAANRDALARLSIFLPSHSWDRRGRLRERKPATMKGYYEDEDWQYTLERIGMSTRHRLREIDKAGMLESCRKPPEARTDKELEDIRTHTSVYDYFSNDPFLHSELVSRRLAPARIPTPSLLLLPPADLRPPSSLAHSRAAEAYYGRVCPKGQRSEQTIRASCALHQYSRSPHLLALLCLLCFACWLTMHLPSPLAS